MKDHATRRELSKAAKICLSTFSKLRGIPYHPGQANQLEPLEEIAPLFGMNVAQLRKALAGKLQVLKASEIADRYDLTPSQVLSLAKRGVLPSPVIFNPDFRINRYDVTAVDRALSEARPRKVRQMREAA
jgi:hypothetical protein